MIVEILTKIYIISFESLGNAMDCKLPRDFWIKTFITTILNCSWLPFCFFLIELKCCKQLGRVWLTSKWDLWMTQRSEVQLMLLRWGAWKFCWKPMKGAVSLVEESILTKWWIQFFWTKLRSHIANFCWQRETETDRHSVLGGTIVLVTVTF